MEETHVFQEMKEIDLVDKLERISSKFPNRILMLTGCIFKKNQMEKLEIIIFKGFSSSTTHPIEIDSESKVIEYDFKLTNFRLYESPLTETKENFIRENKNSFFFLDQKNWI